MLYYKQTFLRAKASVARKSSRRILKIVTIKSYSLILINSFLIYCFDPLECCVFALLDVFIGDIFFYSIGYLDISSAAKRVFISILVDRCRQRIQSYYNTILEE